MPEERKQHRLEAWVDRELRALLQTDDVAIVRAYVMGLVRGIGFASQQVDCMLPMYVCHIALHMQWLFLQQRPTAGVMEGQPISEDCICLMQSSADKAAACAQAAGEALREEGTGNARTDAAAALKPFLHEHAAQFWHELR